MIETETQIIEVTLMNEKTTTIIETTQDHINDKVEME